MLLRQIQVTEDLCLWQLKTGDLGYLRMEIIPKNNDVLGAFAHACRGSTR